MQKQSCFNKKIQFNFKWKKNYYHSIFIQYNKSSINLFSLYSIKKIKKNLKKRYYNILEGKIFLYFEQA